MADTVTIAKTVDVNTEVEATIDVVVSASCQECGATLNVKGTADIDGDISVEVENCPKCIRDAFEAE